MQKRKAEREKQRNNLYNIEKQRRLDQDQYEIKKML